MPGFFSKDGLLKTVIIGGAVLSGAGTLVAHLLTHQADGDGTHQAAPADSGHFHDTDEHR